MVPKGQGAVAYGVLYGWFTDVSGLGLATQARMLMHPAPPKREEELAEHVEMWLSKVRRLEAHGEDLLAKVQDYSSRRKLDSSARERLQHGVDPMDVGVVGG